MQLAVDDNIISTCSTPACPYHGEAEKLDPDRRCLNCSDDVERDRIEMESEIRQEPHYQRG